MKLAVMLTAALLAPGAYAQTAPGPLGLTAEQLDDADLIDPQGREIGEVENLMVGPKGDVVGLVVDSVLFLWLAFGSLEFLAGQIIGKLWMVLLALPAVHWIRKREIARQTAIVE